ncbi:GTP-binding protein, partial [Paenibacillus sonchi]
TLPEEQQLEVLATEPDMKARWDETWGDRMNEVVFIGVGMNRAGIEARLDRCLLNEEEMQQDWSRFNNPLPWPADEFLTTSPE